MTDRQPPSLIGGMKSGLCSRVRAARQNFGGEGEAFDAVMGGRPAGDAALACACGEVPGVFAAMKDEVVMLIIDGGQRGDQPFDAGSDPALPIVGQAGINGNA